MELVDQILSVAVGYAWGPPLLFLLVGGGAVLTVYSRFLPFGALRHGVDILRGKFDKQDDPGDISHFQSLMTALGTTVGTANIVGVATAITAGGPGALFWMWVAAFIGMATKYSEAVLGVRFRETDSRGEKCGGPMVYLENGIRWGQLGRGLAVSFALFASLAARVPPIPP